MTRFLSFTLCEKRSLQIREHFKESLNENGGEKFIERDRSKVYRLSTYPEFVRWDREQPR